MSIKLISFDVWNTLISSNPEYAKHRNRYIANKLNLKVGTIRNQYKNIKQYADNMVQIQHHCLLNEELYRLLLKSSNRESYNWLELRTGVEELFIKYPPQISSNIIKYLQLLNQQGIKLSIASNTNFIRGEVLRKAILNTCGIHWSFQLFSDELFAPKPDQFIWRVLLDKANKIGLTSDDIIHIGDNKLCDGSCVQLGIRYRYNKNPYTLLQTIESLHV